MAHVTTYREIIWAGWVAYITQVNSRYMVHSFGYNMTDRSCRFLGMADDQVSIDLLAIPNSGNSHVQSHLTVSVDSTRPGLAMALLGVRYAGWYCLSFRNVRMLHGLVDGGLGAARCRRR